MSQDAVVNLPAWVHVGSEFRWWSAAQKKYHPVVAASVDWQKRRVVVHLKANSTVRKIVPFNRIRHSRPLQRLAPKSRTSPIPMVANNNGTMMPSWYKGLNTADSRKSAQILKYQDPMYSYKYQEIAEQKRVQPPQQPEHPEHQEEQHEHEHDESESDSDSDSSSSDESSTAPWYEHIFNKERSLCEEVAEAARRGILKKQRSDEEGQRGWEKAEDKMRVDNICHINTVSNSNIGGHQEDHEAKASTTANVQELPDSNLAALSKPWSAPLVPTHQTLPGDSPLTAFPLKGDIQARTTEVVEGEAKAEPELEYQARFANCGNIAPSSVCFQTSNTQTLEGSLPPDGHAKLPHSALASAESLSIPHPDVEVTPAVFPSWPSSSSTAGITISADPAALPPRIAKATQIEGVHGPETICTPPSVACGAELSVTTLPPPAAAFLEQPHSLLATAGFSASSQQEKATQEKGSKEQKPRQENVREENGHAEQKVAEQEQVYRETCKRERVKKPQPAQEDAEQQKAHLETVVQKSIEMERTKQGAADPEKAACNHQHGAQKGSGHQENVCIRTAEDEEKEAEQQKAEQERAEREKAEREQEVLELRVQKAMLQGELEALNKMRATQAQIGGEQCVSVVRSKRGEESAKCLKDREEILSVEHSITPEESIQASEDILGRFLTSVRHPQPSTFWGVPVEVPSSLTQVKQECMNSEQEEHDGRYKRRRLSSFLGA